MTNILTDSLTFLLHRKSQSLHQFHLSFYSFVQLRSYSTIKNEIKLEATIGLKEMLHHVSAQLGRYKAAQIGGF